MKKLLLILGVFVILVGVLALLFAALSCFSFYNLMDGSPVLYQRLRSGMLISLVIGVALVGMGVGCFVIRAKR